MSSQSQNIRVKQQRNNAFYCLHMSICIHLLATNLKKSRGPGQRMCKRSSTNPGIFSPKSSHCLSQNVNIEMLQSWWNKLKHKRNVRKPWPLVFTWETRSSISPAQKWLAKTVLKTKAQKLKGAASSCWNVLEHSWRYCKAEWEYASPLLREWAHPWRAL